MLYKTDKKKLADPFLSRRVRLLPCQKEMVLYWYKEGIAIRAIARMFKVDKRTIQFLLFPERKAKNIKDRENRGGSKIYYKKDYHNQKTREHRSYKHKVLKNLPI